MIRITGRAALLAGLITAGASQAYAAADLQEQIVKMIERQAKSVSSNAPDCDKIGAALLKYVDADGALTKKAVEADKGKSKEQKKQEQEAFLKKYATRIKAAQAKMAPLKACTSNEKVMEWRKKLEAAGEAGK